jgi:4'-phosphopantetheinyl transferase
MPVIYYTYYEPGSRSVAEVSRLEHDLGRVLLAKGLKELYDAGFAAAEDLTLSSGPDGKPYLTNHPDIHFNITHCSGLVACAFSDSSVGIDAERIGYFPEVLIGRVLADSEKELLMSCSHDEYLRQECFWRLWTLKEAYVKKSGVGVDTDLKAFSFDFDAAVTPGYGIPSPVRCSDNGVSCHQIFMERGHIMSLCTDRASGSSHFDIYENIEPCCREYYNNNSNSDIKR